jgi:glyoxylate carboligase
MTAAQAAVLVTEREAVRKASGAPGAAINPPYAALKPRNTISHILARHVARSSASRSRRRGRGSTRRFPVRITLGIVRALEVLANHEIGSAPTT